jgi:hypothetical protein
VEQQVDAERVRVYTVNGQRGQKMKKAKRGMKRKEMKGLPESSGSRRLICNSKEKGVSQS